MFLSIALSTWGSADSVKVMRMKATFYADKFQGRKTASGEVFNQKKLTAAHNTIKFGTWVKVTNLKNGSQVIVKINDRCPKRGVIDLTKTAAQQIGIRGTGNVTVEILPAGYDTSNVEERQETVANNDDEPRKTVKNKKNDKKKSGFTSKPSLNCDIKREERIEYVPNKFNVELCVAENEHQAHQEIEQLPDPYQEYAKAIRRKDVKGYSVILDIRDTKLGAYATVKRLLADYPKAKVVLCGQ